LIIVQGKLLFILLNLAEYRPRTPSGIMIPKETPINNPAPNKLRLVMCLALLLIHIGQEPDRSVTANIAKTNKENFKLLLAID